MSLWSDFTDTISVRAKEAINRISQIPASIVGNIGATAASQAVAPVGSQNQVLMENTLRQNVQDALEENKPFDINLEQKSNDLILKAAIAAHDKVISPYVTRPMATVGLLTDTSSPLYKKGEFEQGFQLKDIADAYKRSAKVSTMQALTKSDLVPFAKPISAAVLSTGGIDIDDIDLWDDKSIEKNFSDNVVGKWFTGIGDFVVGNYGVGLAAKGIGKGVKAFAKTGGVYTKGKTNATFEQEVREGFKFSDSNGTTGMQSVGAQHMQELAGTEDIGIITDLVDKYSTNPKLIPILRDVKTKEAALDIILADKGDINAMHRLSMTDPDHLFEMADVPSQIQAKTLLTGEAFIPEGDAVLRLKSAYDAAIKKNPQYDELRKAFLDDDYNPLVGGRDYFPMEPKIGATAKAKYVKAESNVRGFKTDIRFRDLDKHADIIELKLGSRIGAPASKFFKFAVRNTQLGTTYKPLGFVTFSGMRPADAQVELNAFLDNIPLFKDGARNLEYQPGVYKRVSDIRKEFEAVFIQAKTPVETVKALESIDEKVGYLIAYANGHYVDADIKAQIASMRAHMVRQSEAFQKNGYAVEHDSSISTTNAKTMRQMAESYRFTPWDAIEEEFIRMGQTSAKKVAGTEVKATIKSFYEDLTRIWTFDVLARPMFITKQSIVEPLISTYIAAGMETVGAAGKTMLKRYLINSRNASMGYLSKRMSKPELEAANRLTTDAEKKLSKLIAIKDMVQAQRDEIFYGKSPALKEQHLPAIEKDLKALERAVEAAELEARDAFVLIGAREAVPSKTLLERRIAYLEQTSDPAIRAKIQQKGWTGPTGKIANAKNVIKAYQSNIQLMAINPKVLQEAEDNLAKAYDDIDAALKELGEANVRQANVFGKGAKFKERYYGPENQLRFVGGEWVSLDSFVNSKTGKNFNRAVRAEVGNARTVEQNYIGELSVGTRKAILERKVPNVPIKVNNPIYFEELTHVANDLIRGDDLMDLILAEKTLPELIEWGSTSAGLNYLKHFGVMLESQIPAYMQDKIALIHRTFPSVEARAAILEREVTAQELQTWLSPYIEKNRLFEIAPTDFAYAERPMFGNKWYTTVENFVGNMTARVFKLLTAPENPIREAYFDKTALDAMARKAETLLAQGVKMTPERWNALRQSAGREALQELEKTIYTVRRQTRALHTARLAVAFPTATLNAFYRYGRLTVKNPERAVGFLYNYGRTFKTFGVDKNGNPTSNPDEISHLIVPGSKDLGLGIAGEGIALNARSVGFMLNWATPSFISALSVGTIMNWLPAGEEPVKKALGPLWDQWFPYGAPDSLTKQLTPPWANAAYNAVTGDMGKKDFLASVKSIQDYHGTLRDLGIEKKAPSQEQMRNEARALWEQKARWAFISPFGVPIKVETNKMDLIDTLWYTLINKAEKSGATREEATAIAGDEILSIVGPSFLLDRVSYNATTERVNVPESVEAWNRIFKDNDALVAKLAGIKKGDIRLVGLLAADLTVAYEDRNTAIVKKLRDPNLKLPGTSELVNAVSKTPAEEEKLRQKNRAWRDFQDMRDALESDIPDGRTARSYPNIAKILDAYATETLRKQSPEWYDEYKGSISGDSAYQYGRAFDEIIKDKKFLTDKMTSPFWQDVVSFNAFRNEAAKIYNSMNSKDLRRKRFKENYMKALEESIPGYHPKLQDILKNNFMNDNLEVTNYG